MKGFWSLWGLQTDHALVHGLGCRSYLDACQNDGPFLGYPKYSVPYYIRDLKRDHIFDNHPFQIGRHPDNHTHTHTHDPSERESKSKVYEV